MVYSLTDAPINGSPYWNIADVKVGDVLLLQGTWDGIPKEVTVKAGTFIFVPINSMWGEQYADGSTDDPNDPNLDGSGHAASSWGSMLTMSQTLDGSPVRVDLKNYGVPITWFDQPIYYADTSSWDSVAAIWFQSYGFMIKPLTPGVHTLTNVVEDQWFSSSFTDTYKITVVR